MAVIKSKPVVFHQSELKIADWTNESNVGTVAIRFDDM